MEEYIQKLEEWMDQVRDDETDIEDYDFLGEVVTEGNTLGNIGSYLAVYEEDGDLYVDDELLEAMDEKKTEIAKEESPSPENIRERTNHREAVYGDLTGKEKQKIRNEETTIQELREAGEIDKGLLDGSFDGQTSGHGFVQNMIDEFKQNADYKKVSSPDKENTQKSGENKYNSDQKHEQDIVLPSGGVKLMTDYEDLNNQLDAVYDSLESLEAGLESIPQDNLDSELDTLAEEIYDVRNYVSRIEGALEAAQLDARNMERTIQRDDQILDITVSTLESISATVSDYKDQLAEYVDFQEDVKEDLNGALDTLQDIGEGANYEGPSDELREIMDDRLDDEGFEEFQEAADRF